MTGWLVFEGDFLEVRVSNGDWSVDIPPAGDYGMWAGHGSTREEAVTDMEGFVREAQAALEALKTSPEPARLAAIAAEHDIRYPKSPGLEYRCTCGRALGVGGGAHNALDLHRTAVAKGGT